MAKNVFQACVINGNGKVPSNKAIKRDKFEQYLTNQPASQVVFEACGGAHHWVRRAQAYGHQAVIILPRQVTPYRQAGAKNGLKDSSDRLVNQRCP